MASKINRVNIRRTHPVLYRTITADAICCLLLAANFWIFTPTFSPFDINKTWVAAAFFLLGLWLLFFLNVIRNLTMIRIGSGVLVVTLVAWGAGNMQQSLLGNASFQLPIVYFTLAAIHLLLFMEPPVNPATERIE